MISCRLCTITCFYRYAEQEGIIEHSPAVHVRRPKLDYESHAIGLDRNELGAMLVAAGLAGARDHALISLLALNGLHVSEAIGARIEDLALQRGHRILTVVRKGGRIVCMPRAPRTARAVDLVVGERFNGTILYGHYGQPLDRHGAARIVRRVAKPAGSPNSSALTPCGTVRRRSPRRRSAAARASKKPRLTPTSDPRCAMTEPACSSTDTPPTSSPPTSPARHAD